jgi:hypothetical protein
MIRERLGEGLVRVLDNESEWVLKKKDSFL